MQAAEADAEAEEEPKAKAEAEAEAKQEQKQKQQQKHRQPVVLASQTSHTYIQLSTTNSERMLKTSN